MINLLLPAKRLKLWCLGDKIYNFAISLILCSRPLKTIFQREVYKSEVHANFFISHKRTLIALLKLYAAAANKTLIASPFTPL